MPNTSRGLKICTAMVESPLKKLVESPLHQLNGNGLTSSAIIYTNSSLTKRLNGIHNGIPGNVYGFDNDPSTDASAAFGLPKATPADYYPIATDAYSQQVDNFDDNEGNTYTGVMTVVNNLPYSSGYPSRLNASGIAIIPSGSHAYFNNDQGNNIVPGDLGAMSQNFSYMDENLSNGQVVPAMTLTSLSSVKVYNNGQPYPNDFAFRMFTSTLSGVIDFGPYYDTAKADFLGITWHSGSTAFSCNYNEPFGFGTDLTSFNYAANNLAFNIFTSSGTPAPAFGNQRIANGWIYGGNGLTLNRGLAINQTGAPQGYWIGRKRDYASVQSLANAGSGFYETRLINAGVTYTVSQIDLIQTGTIENGKTIGIGCDIELPWPSSNPFPYINSGNNIVISDYYFAIIGRRIPSGSLFVPVTAVTT